MRRYLGNGKPQAFSRVTSAVVSFWPAVRSPVVVIPVEPVGFSRRVTG